MACIVCADYLGSGLAGVAAAAAVSLDSWRLTVAGYAAATLAATVLAVAFVIFAPPISPLRPSDLRGSVPENPGRLPSEDFSPILDSQEEEHRHDVHAHTANSSSMNDVRSPLFGHEIGGSNLGGGRIIPQQKKNLDRHHHQPKLLPLSRTHVAAAAGRQGPGSVSAVRAIAGVAAISVDRHFTEGAKAHPSFHPPTTAAPAASQSSSGKHAKGKKRPSINTNIAADDSNADNGFKPTNGTTNTSDAVPSTIQENEHEASKQQHEARASERCREGSYHSSSRSRGSSVVLGRRSVSILDGSVGYEHDSDIWGDDNSVDVDDECSGSNVDGAVNDSSRDSRTNDSRWSLTRHQRRPITVICASPKLLLVFLGGGIRYVGHHQ